MSMHNCSHSGYKIEEFVTGETSRVSEERDCGYGGWLCDMCKRDADRENTDRLVEGLALAGVLASPHIKPANIEDGARSAMRHAAALREREGGEGS